MLEEVVPARCFLVTVVYAVFSASTGKSVRGGEGNQQTIDDLAEMMLHLQRIGCLNINVVTPTHYSAHIILALDKAVARGLRLPLVYNTCGWEKTEILEILDGTPPLR